MTTGGAAWNGHAGKSGNCYGKAGSGDPEKKDHDLPMHATWEQESSPAAAHQ